MRSLLLLVPVFILGLGIGLITPRALPKPSNEPSTAEITNTVGEMALYHEHTDGTRSETGLKVPFDASGAYRISTLIASPNEQQALYTMWENAKVVIYVSNIDGTNARPIATQSFSEGNGGLDVSSISWSDDSQKISYIESGIECATNCQTLEDIASVFRNYEVDVATGEKVLIEEERQ